jgi:hypothetical protein
MACFSMLNEVNHATLLRLADFRFKIRACSWYAAGQVVAQWLRRCVTSRTIADSKLDGLIQFYQFT